MKTHPFTVQCKVIGRLVIFSTINNKMQPNVFIYKSPSIVCGQLLLTPLMNSLYEVVVGMTDGVVGKSQDDPIHTGTWHFAFTVQSDPLCCVT